MKNASWEVRRYMKKNNWCINEDKNGKCKNYRP